MLFIALFLFYISLSDKLPHIVFIIVDDVGHSDVHYNGAEFETPTIDRLANRGLRLTNYHVHATCTPTRAALLTGRYGFNLGLAGHLLQSSLAGLPKDIPNIPKLLQSKGYKTHLVGKWHLGHAKWSMVPTNQGFDSFVGILGPANWHFSHFMGFDWTGAFDYMRIHQNGSWSHDIDGRYSSDAYADEAVRLIKTHDKEEPMFLYLSFQGAHTPVQTLPKYLEPCAHLKNHLRKGLCGQMQAIDSAISRVWNQFDQSFPEDDVLLFFTSDNGGYLLNGGLNKPYRGEKTTTYRGATSVPAFLVDFSGKYVTQGEYNGMMHVSDMFPTVASWVHGKCPANIDGVDQSKALRENSIKSPRSEVILFYDDLFQSWSLQRDNWKLMITRMDVNNDLFQGWDTGPETEEKHSFWIVWPLYITKLLFSIGNYDQMWMIVEYARNLNLVMANLRSGRSEVNMMNIFSQENLAFKLMRHEQIVHLFDIQSDPSESVDLAENYPEIVDEMKKLLEKYIEDSPEDDGWDKAKRGNSPFLYLDTNNCGDSKMPESVDVYTQTIFESWQWKLGLIPCRFMHPFMEEDEFIAKEDTVEIVYFISRSILPILFCLGTIFLCVFVFLIRKCCSIAKVF